MNHLNLSSRNRSYTVHLRHLMCVMILLGISSLNPSKIAPLVQTGYAQPTEQTTKQTTFKQLLRRAQKSYQAKRYQEALKHFEDAMAATPDFHLHWNLSVCHHKLGNIPKALFHVNEYLRLMKPNPKMKQKAETYRAKLLSTLEE